MDSLVNGDLFDLSKILENAIPQQQAHVDDLNKDNIAIYTYGFNQWSLNFVHNDYKSDNPPPFPPKKLLLVVGEYWYEIVDSDELVCQPLPIPHEDFNTSNIKVGKYMRNGFYAIVQGDGNQEGFRVKLPNGKIVERWWTPGGGYWGPCRPEFDGTNTNYPEATLL